MQYSPDVKLWKGRIYNIWVSDHVGGTSSDIWAHVLEWNNPTSIGANSKSVIDDFQLFQNYPNPFNPLTTICYTLPNAAMVEFNILGLKIRTMVQQQPAGQYQVQWNGWDENGHIVPSGVYIYKLQIGNKIHSRKMD